VFDPAPPTDGAEFEAWLAGELRRPVPPDPTRTERVMARVRRVAPRAQRRRHWTPPALGLAVAAGLAGLAALHPLAIAARPAAAARAGAEDMPSYRDTLVAAIGGVLRDTIRGAMEVAVLDTSRLVRFTLVAPAAVRVAVAGDFNGWDPRATPLAALAANGAWSVAVTLSPGRHRYAFVVDDTQWVADPAAARALPDTTN
jgi:hypothetical protein